MLQYRRQLEIPSTGGMSGRRLLLTNDIGDTLVLTPGTAYREHVHNYLDEGSGATAVANGRLLLLRGSKQLDCIGGK